MAGASKKVGQVANRIATATQSVFKSLFQQPQPAPSPTAAGAPNSQNTVTAGDTPTTGAKGVVSPVNVVLPAAARSATTAAGANTTPQPVGVGVIDVVSPTMTSAHGSGVASDAESQTGSSFIPSTAVADVPKVWLFELSSFRRVPISVDESVVVVLCCQQSSVIVSEPAGAILERRVSLRRAARVIDIAPAPAAAQVCRRRRIALFDQYCF